MLHVLNGETTEAILSRTSIPGTRFSFRDALIAGPAPRINGTDWRRLRANHLADAYGVEVNKCEQDLARQDEVFASFTKHEEVTLWFESDLFCQTNLLYVLDWLAHHDLGDTILSLICIGAFPGRQNFRGLGELEPGELASLFPQRKKVTREQLDLAVRAWQGYRASDPLELELLLQTDTAELPFLKRALQLHLARFPSVRNGLNRIESKALELTTDGLDKFKDLFPRFIDAEPDYGLGDAQFWNVLQRLTHGPQPLLLNSTGESVFATGTSSYAEQSFAITDAGAAVLRGASDSVNLNGIDEWLGGVHLVGRTDIWRWDDRREKLVRQ